MKSEQQYQSYYQPMLILILVPLIISSTSAINYQYEDNFSSVGSWNFTGTDWSSGSLSSIKVVEPEVEISNGELTFSGDQDTSILNESYLPYAQQFGCWSFDVYLPSTALAHTSASRIWGFHLTALPLGPGKNQTHFDNLNFSIEKGETHIFAYNGTMWTNIKITQNLSETLNFDANQHFDFLRIDR